LTAATGTRDEGGAVLPESRDVAVAAARAAADKQAGEIVILDVHETIVITDYFVICTAGTQRQIRTVIDAVEDALRGLGVKPMRREGEPEAGWWLLDYIDVVVHVFGTEERAYYDLERLWSDAPRVRWEPDDNADAASTAR
jgi:ribosome-associated protein